MPPIPSPLADTEKARYPIHLLNRNPKRRTHATDTQPPG